MITIASRCLVLSADEKSDPPPAEDLLHCHEICGSRSCGQAMAELTSGSTLKAAVLLEQMRLHMATDAGKEIAKKVGLVYQLNIAPKKIGQDEEIFVVDLKNGAVTKGPYEGKPDATFSFRDDDFLAVATGKLNPQMAFLRGAMKIKGSLSAAQKFTPDIFPKPAKL